MAPYQFIDRPSPFNTSGGKTLPIFAVTPAHIDIGAIDPIALDWARKAGFKAEAGAVLLIPSADGHLGGALFGLGANPSESPFLTGKLARNIASRQMAYRDRSADGKPAGAGVWPRLLQLWPLQDFG